MRNQKKSAPGGSEIWQAGRAVASPFAGSFAELPQGKEVLGVVAQASGFLIAFFIALPIRHLR